MQSKQPTATLREQFRMFSGILRPVNFQKIFLIPYPRDPWRWVAPQIVRLDAPKVVLVVKCAHIVQHYVNVETWCRDSAPGVFGAQTYLRRECEPRPSRAAKISKPLRLGDMSRDCYTILKVGNFFFVTVVFQTVRDSLEINSVRARVYRSEEDGSKAPKPVVDLDYTELPVTLVLHDWNNFEYHVTWQNHNRATDTKLCKYICRNPDVETELNIVHCISHNGLGRVSDVH